MRVLLWISLALMGIASLGCESEETLWAKAEEGDLEASAKYVEKYPDSQNATQLEELLAKVSWEKLPDGRMLITKGFDYLQNELSRSVLRVDDVIEGTLLKGQLMVFPTCVHPSSSGGLTFLTDAVGSKWVFTKKDLVFHCETSTNEDAAILAFQSQREGATVEFAKDGVILSGFTARIFSSGNR